MKIPVVKIIRFIQMIWLPRKEIPITSLFLQEENRNRQEEILQNSAEIRKAG
jgi:hypothetical protein